LTGNFEQLICPTYTPSKENTLKQQIKLKLGSSTSNTEEARESIILQ
jgi:hypothetical protein